MSLRSLSNGAGRYPVSLHPWKNAGFVQDRDTRTELDIKKILDHDGPGGTFNPGQRNNSNLILSVSATPKSSNCSTRKDKRS